MSLQIPFRILELNVICAQDLPPVSKLLRTYVSACVHPDHKLTTHIDRHGHANPTWNNKMAFRVDERFLASNSSAISLEIYNVAWLRDLPVGSAIVPIRQLFSPPAQKLKGMTTRTFALHIRRPSGHLQGTLNVVVNLLDKTARSMPLGGPCRLSPESQNQLQRWDENAIQIIQRWKSEITTEDHEDLCSMHDGASTPPVSRSRGRERRIMAASIKNNEPHRYVVRKPVEVAAEQKNESDSVDVGKVVMGRDQWKTEGGESADGETKTSEWAKCKQVEDDETPMSASKHSEDEDRRGQRRSGGGLLWWLERKFNCRRNSGRSQEQKKDQRRGGKLRC